MSTDPPLSIFNNDDSGLSDDWVSFIKTPDVNCVVDLKPVATTSGTSLYPNLKCINSRFWNLAFDTAENITRFQLTDYNVAGKALVGLSSTLLKDPHKNLGEVLVQFGVTPDQYSDGSIVSKIINAIGTSQTLAIDTKEMRCAMWFTPGQMLQVDTALAFQPNVSDGNVLDTITRAIYQTFGLNTLDRIASPKILLQRTCTGLQVAGADGKLSWMIRSSYTLSLRLATGGFLFWLTLQPTGVSCSVTQDPDAQLSTDSLWKKMDDLGGSGLSSSSSRPALGDFMSNVSLLSFSVGEDFGGEIWWQVTAALQLARSGSGVGNKDPVDIYLAYDSQSSTFSGGLMLANFYATSADKLLPTYRVGRDLDPPAGVTLPGYWDLAQFAPEIDSLPIGLPTAIAQATIKYQKSNPSTLWLSATLVAPPPPPTSSYVPAPFVWDMLNVQLSKGANFSCSLSADFSINPRPGDPYPPAELGLAIAYSSAPGGSGGNWLLSAYASNLSCGLLWGFFDSNYADPLVSVLGKLNIASLEVLYTYEAAGSATSFVFTGIITLDKLELRLFYQYASSKAGPVNAAQQTLTGNGKPKPLVVNPKAGGEVDSDWIFECDLEASAPDATIGSIITSMVDDALTLPPFVSDIPIPSATGRSPISVKVAKTVDGQILFAFRVAIESFTLTFVQVANKDKNIATKRLLRFAVDKIPLVQNIPLLDNLPQPFDQLEYVWVNDSGGLLQSEVEALNSHILLGQDSLLFKKVVADKPTNVVIQPGHHFIVISNGAVAVDHVFYASKPAVTSQPTFAIEGLGGKPQNSAVLKASAPNVPSSAPAKGSLAFTLGPLSISAVTLQYKEQGPDKFLFVTMDATFALGPLSFSLLGFSIGLPLMNIKLSDLSGIVAHIQVQLNGLALSFNKPPLLVAGAFEHQVIGTGANQEDIYLGGIGISFPPYTFVGLGEYAILSDFKSVFIYAKLDGPLITLEFATISGVRLGLGYNSVVRSPTIDQLSQFPFINDAGTSGAGNDPMKILKAMCQSPSGNPITDPPWVSPKLDSYWLAAGMTVKAFDILTITAVAMFAFRDSGLIISLFADAVAQMPPDVTDKSELIVYVEIGLVAEMNFVDGYFRVEASLAPTSFLLVPQCHVYGGFALVYWFGDNPHAGDWVFSIGGYHRSYTPPAWYPVPARIGISFPIGVYMSVTGQAYFAITPKVAMGGALIHVSLSVGPVTAWLDAAFDALVNFHPLHYTATFSVSVGCSITIDIWFIHICISVSIGALLHIEGPEFGGVAHVDFYLFAFDIEFGAQNQAPDPLDLQAFWEMVHNRGPSSTSIQQSEPNPVQSLLSFDKHDSHPPATTVESGAALKFILEDGNSPQPQLLDSTSTAPPSSTGAGAKWFVKGGTFRFSISTDFALSSAEIEASSDESKITPDASKLQPIYSRPMHLKDGISSSLTITIKEKSSGTIISGWQNVNFTLKSVPTAIWAAYNEALDPTRTQDPGALLNGDTPTMPLAMGIEISSPAPILAPSFIPVFNATAAARFGILDFRTNPLGTSWILKATESKQTKYLPAALTSAQQGETSEQRWQEVHDTWSGLTSKKDIVNDPTNGVLAMCVSVFAWNKNRPQTEDPLKTTPPAAAAATTPAVSKSFAAAGGSAAKKLSPVSQTATLVPPWQLLGTLPSKLIANIESAYLALPRVAVIGT